MRLPPCIVDMRVRAQERTRFRLWLPLVILWPLLLVFVILALIVSLLVDAALLISGQGHHYTRLVIGCLEVLGESRGVEVSVRGRDNTVMFTLT